MSDTSAGYQAVKAGRPHRGSRRSGPRRLGRRLAQLYAGLVAFGVSLALMVRARLGLSPWDVLNQGVARHLGLQIGWVVIAVGLVVLLAWIPLRQRPGIGTMSNIVLVGLAANAALDRVAAPNALGARVGLLVAGIALNATATAAYIGANLGPGPRDGLMTGLARRGYSIGATRTAIEAGVLVVGAGLGGSVGIGTIAYAVAIGPLVQGLFPRLRSR